jgi:hypothetical protein
MPLMRVGKIWKKNQSNMKKALNFLLAIIPLIHLLLFFILLYIFKCEYGQYPLNSGIDPKDIGLNAYIRLINILMIVSFLEIPYFVVLIFLRLKSKIQKDFRVVILFGISFLCFLLNLKFNPNMFWFFD